VADNFRIGGRFGPGNSGREAMKILISGVCGFVGGSLARYFREHDSTIEVAGFDSFIRAGSETNRRCVRKVTSTLCPPPTG
jgi:prephenate dehydrogenase